MKRKFLVLLALLFPVMAFATPKPLTICTGGEGGAYEALGNQIGGDIAKKTGAQLDVINTGGSIENAELMSSGDCYMAIMQGDAVVSRSMPRDVSVTNAHTEAVYWIHGKDGLKDLADITDKNNANRAVAIVGGSGAEVTLDNFAKVDEDYKNVRSVEFDDWYAVAEAASQGYTMKAGVRVNIAGLLYVGRPGFIPKDITEDFGKQLTIGEIDESSFGNTKDLNGNPLYYKCAIAKNQTNGLEVDTWGKPDTYCMNAAVVYNNAYTDGLEPKEARDVKRAVSKGINGVLKAVRQ